jgi:hypothetical protein
VLPPIGGGVVTVWIGSRELGLCHLDAVETCGTFDAEVVLRFREVMPTAGDR